MAMKFFSIPATMPGEAEQEMNRFLRAHRVVAIDRQFAVVGGAAMWCLAVEFLKSAAPVVTPDAVAAAQRFRFLHQEVEAGIQACRRPRQRTVP